MSKITGIIIILSFSVVLMLAANISSAQIIWKEILPSKEGDLEFNYRALSFSNAKNGTVIGELTDTTKFLLSIILRRSTDGGLSWTSQESGIPDFTSIHGPNLQKVYAMDSLNVMAVGDSGLMIRTTDAGNSWMRQGSKMATRLRDVSFSDPDHGIVVGDNGTVFITSDAGKSWEIHSKITNSYFHITKAFRNSCYYVFSYYNMKMFRTFDGGNTWDSIPIVNHSLKDLEPSFINSIHFFDSLHFLAVGGHANDAGAINFYSISTTDGGHTWTQVMDTNYNFRDLNSVSFFDSLTGIATSVVGYMIITRDGGNTWNLFTDPSRQNVVGVYFTEKKHLLAIYNRGFFSSVMYGTLQDAGVANSMSPQSDQISNYPNPLSSETNVKYHLSAESFVHCIIQDILGRELQRIDLGRQEIGEHTFTINASKLAVGSYYYSIEAEGRRITKQMIIIR